MARKRTPPRRSGLLLIDKHPGWTSHDVVGRVRRVVGERQVGHTGTLDPAATGLLVVAVGHATRLLSFAEAADKTYVATVRFGVTTDSGDRDGRLLSTADAGHLGADAIVAALEQFRGEIDQVPPMHSAIKVAGRRLYQAAKAGEEVDIPTRRVTVHALELLAWEPPDATLLVRASAGTYIRSLARDLGASLGPGAMLAGLTRTRAGRFSLARAVSINALEAQIEQWGWSTVALHPDMLLPDADMAVLRADEEERWFNGLPIPREVSTGIVRVYDSRRNWIGVGERDPDAPRILPRRVVRTGSE